MRIRYSKDALDDLESILEYIASDSLKVAEETVIKIRHTEDNIKLFPGAARYDVESDTYERCIQNTRLIIIYHLMSTLDIEIIAIFHTSRNPKAKRRIV